VDRRLLLQSEWKNELLLQMDRRTFASKRMKEILLQSGCQFILCAENRCRKIINCNM